MGFRYRKSINLGKGFRVNISKSGIGYSYGVKGARITKTANGRTRQTLSIPGTGISYVSESGSQKPTNNVKESEQKFSEAVDNLNFESLDSGIYDKAVKNAQKWNIVSSLMFLFSAFLFIAAFFNPLLFIAVAILFISSVVITQTLGRISVEYELDDHAKQEYEKLCTSWKRAFESFGVWQISQTCITNNKKDNCGAKEAIKPVTIQHNLFSKIVPNINTNIEPLCIPIVNDKGKTNGQVIVLPDRVVVSKGLVLAAIENKFIKTTVSVQPMALPDNSYPSDAMVVEHRYLHQNKDGSPDKRYSDNPIFPVVHYGRVDVETNGSTILSLLFSNVAKIENLEKQLPIENLNNISDTITVNATSDNENGYDVETFAEEFDENREIPQKGLSAAEDKPNEPVGQLNKKKIRSSGIGNLTKKQIKRFFALAVAIAAVITLVLEIALYSPEDGIVVSIMMFIFCTTVLSIPLVIGTLLICLPSIRYNRKNRGEDDEG